MNLEETGKLLALAALYDNRKVGVPDVMAWHRAIGDLPYADAEAAVVEHYGSDSTERLMPGHVRRRVKAMRADRLARTPLPAPPAEAADKPGRYKQIIAANVGRIADGMDVHKALGPGAPLPGDPPTEWQQARESLKRPDPVKPDPRDVALEQVKAARAKRESSDEGEPAA